MHIICGYGTKVMHTTTDNIAHIMFRSDFSIVKLGFNITFTSIEGMQVFQKYYNVILETGTG